MRFMTIEIGKLYKLESPFDNSPTPQGLRARILRRVLMRLYDHKNETVGQVHWVVGGAVGMVIGNFKSLDDDIVCLGDEKVSDRVSDGARYIILVDEQLYVINERYIGESL